MKILILTSYQKNYSTTRLIEEFKKRGHEVQALTPSDFYIYVSNVTGKDRVYIKSDRVFKKNVDAIVCRLGPGLHGPNLVRHFDKNMNVYVTGSADGIQTASNKWKTIQLLSKDRIRVPKSVLVHNPEHAAFLFQLVDGFKKDGSFNKVVGKTLRGSRGTGVFLINDLLAGSTTLSSFVSSKTHLLLQQFIESAKEDEKKYDIRAWVVGNKVVSAYKRWSLDSDFRSNYSISKEGEKVTLTLEENNMALAAAAAVGLDCCGVDIVRDYKDNNKPYVLEVNSNASLKGIEKVTGDNVAKEIVLHVESKAKSKKSIEQNVLSSTSEKKEYPNYLKDRNTRMMMNKDK